MNRAALLGLASLIALLAGPAQAQRFTNSAKGYSFSMPPGWHLAHPDFMLTSRSGSSLSESDIPAQKQPSLVQISKTAGMIALIGADYEATQDQFRVFGSNWNGLVTVFVEPQRARSAPRHVLQLVTEHGPTFRLFYLAVPSQEWRTRRDEVIALLSALEFH